MADSSAAGAKAADPCEALAEATAGLSVEPAKGADASPGQAGKAPAADPALNWYGMQLTPEQAEKVFVDAFNACKGTLAGFAKCQSIGELRTVQDAFTLALGSKLCPTEYDPVKLVRGLPHPPRVALLARAHRCSPRSPSQPCAQAWLSSVEVQCICLLGF